MWPGWNVIFFIGNIILTAIAIKSSFKLVKYYKKSRNLTVYAQTNKVLSEIEKMQNFMTEIMKVSNQVNRKATNYKKRVSELGGELDACYNNILSELPHDYYHDFYTLRPDSEVKVDLQNYISSLIDGSAVPDEGIDVREHTKYKMTLAKMQEFFKGKIMETEETLK